MLPIKFQRIFAALTALILTIFLSLPAAAQNRVTASPTIMAITNVNVVDVEKGRLLPGMTVLVIGDRISAVSRSSRISLPKNVHIVDARGKYLVPGLWDMHVHIDDAGGWMFPLFIANGVVGVRDMGGRLEQVAIWREMRQRNELMPEVIAAGPIVSGRIGDPDPRMLLVGNRAEAEAAVDRLSGAGVNTIKIHDWISKDSYLALTAAARRKKLPVAGHQPVSITAEEISNAGQQSIEHFGNTWGGLMIDCSSDEAALRRDAQKLIPLTKDEFDPPKLMAALGETWTKRLADSYDPLKCGRLAQVFKRNGTWFDPTIYGAAYAWTFITAKEIAAHHELKYMPAAARKMAVDAAAEDAPGKSPETIAVEQRFYRNQLALVSTMSRAGVGILAGTDSLPFPPLYPGFSLHEELEKLVDAGLTPAEALRAATLNPAKFLGRDAESGAIKAGHIADLVLLDEDPLKSIRNTRKISAVILRGRLLDRKALDGLLAGVENANSK